MFDLPFFFVIFKTLWWFYAVMTNGIWNLNFIIFCDCHNCLGEQINSFGSLFPYKTLLPPKPPLSRLCLYPSCPFLSKPITIMPHKADRATDVQRENFKKKRREMEQPSLDATSDLLDTDSNATFAMVIFPENCSFI